MRVATCFTPAPREAGAQRARRTATWVRGERGAVAVLDDPPRRRARAPRRPARSCAAGARSRCRCGRRAAGRWRAPAAPRCGGRAADDASSSTTTPGPREQARASATSCASPADSPRAVGPSTVSRPSGSSASHRRAPATRTRRRAGRRRTLGVEQPHVVAERAGEQLHILGDEADASPQVVDSQVADVDAADADHAAVDVVEPEQEPGHRRLARAGTAERRRARARPRRETKRRAAPARVS